MQTVVNSCVAAGRALSPDYRAFKTNLAFYRSIVPNLEFSGLEVFGVGIFWKIAYSR